MKQPHEEGAVATVNLSQNKRFGKIQNNGHRNHRPESNLDDDELLERVTVAARDAVESETTLAEKVKACCDQDIDRDDVIEAVINGGFSESRARSIVSEVYCSAGKRERAAGAGTKISQTAIQLGQYVLKTHEDINLAIKDTLAAYRWLRAERERLVGEWKETATE